jgi:hypothetical protein
MATRRLFASQAWHAAAMRKSSDPQKEETADMADAAWPDKATRRGHAVFNQGHEGDGLSGSTHRISMRGRVALVDYSSFFPPY